MLNETFIQLIMKQIQKAENNKFMPLNLSKEQEKKLEKLSPELYSKYIQIKERNATEREKFKAEIKDVTAKIEKRLGAYNVKVIASFDNDDKPLNHPGHYYILVKFTRKLSKDEFAAFVSNAKAIGLKFNPQDKTWGYVGEIGQYPPFNL
jgi:methyltransferase-like protein